MQLSEKKIIRIGTRSSQLALLQAGMVETLLNQNGIETEIIPIKTSGDKYKNVPLNKIGGKMLFAKEIQTAIFEGDIDIAVHSLKDLETKHPESLSLIATLKRDDPSDVFVCEKGLSASFLNDKKPFLFGTCAPRRAAFMSHYWPQCEIIPLRGNVETRLQKVLDQHIDATILAAAGLNRLNLIEKYRDQLDFIFLNPCEFLPAVCQGVIGVEAKEEFKYLAHFLNDAETFLMSTIERKVVEQFDGDCFSAIGVLATKQDENIHVSIRFANKITNKIEVKNISFHLSEMDSFFKKDIFC
jgi:hydroxymethylbilane synthase